MCAHRHDLAPGGLLDGLLRLGGIDVHDAGSARSLIHGAHPLRAGVACGCPPRPPPEKAGRPVGGGWGGEPAHERRLARSPRPLHDEKHARPSPAPHQPSVMIGLADPFFMPSKIRSLTFAISFSKLACAATICWYTGLPWTLCRVVSYCSTSCLGGSTPCCAARSNSAASRSISLR